jgi:hypothetical protein
MFMTMLYSPADVVTGEANSVVSATVISSLKIFIGSLLFSIQCIQSILVMFSVESMGSDLQAI